MTTNDDVLLKEVDEDLRQEQQLNFLKKYAPWLGGAAGALVLGVTGQQIWTGQQGAKRADAASAYFDAILEAPNDVAAAADAMEQVRPQLSGGGYATLAALRQGALRVVAGQPDESLAAYRAVIEDGSAPRRFRDLARLRAAYAQLDTAPEIASGLAAEIETEEFLAHAQEIQGLTALSQGDYERAFETFTKLAAEADDPRLSSRARLFVPVADAGRRGVTLAPERSETNDFIESLTDELSMDDLLTPQAAPTPIDEGTEPSP